MTDTDAAMDTATGASTGEAHIDEALVEEATVLMGLDPHRLLGALGLAETSVPTLLARTEQAAHTGRVELPWPVLVATGAKAWRATSRRLRERHGDQLERIASNGDRRTVARRLFAGPLREEVMTHGRTRGAVLAAAIAQHVEVDRLTDEMTTERSRT